MRYQKTLNGFDCFYTANDIKLLAELDQRHDTPNGFRVKKLCERAYLNFGDINYIRLAAISVTGKRKAVFLRTNPKYP